MRKLAGGGRFLIRFDKGQGGSPGPGRLMPSRYERLIRRCYPAYCLADCADTGLIQELLSLFDNKSLDCIGIRIHHDIALR